MTPTPSMTRTAKPESHMSQAQPSGLLIVDKPQGVTSFDAVAAVRGALHIKKVGHAGTLDPMATGALVIAFGHATRLLNAIVAHDKTYEATIRLGLTTDTDDAEGTVHADESTHSRWKELIERHGGAGSPQVEAFWHDLLADTVASHFTGNIEQVPNTFSAIKINGQRAYDLAREGKDVELTARPVTISKFSVLDVRPGVVMGKHADEPLLETDAASFLSDSAAAPYRSDCADSNDCSAISGLSGESDPSDTVIPAMSVGLIPVLDVDVRVSCSSGTYIRALARDLGMTLGVGGYLTRLRRTRVGRFALPDDASGLIAADAMQQTSTHTITAHVETKSFTNREGKHVTRNTCVLDTSAGLAGQERRDWVLGRALTMEQAARGAMPTVDITAAEAAELRFGRRIERAIPRDTQVAAIAPAVDDASDDVSVDAPADVVAILERANAHQAKPVTVFPLA